MIYKRGSAKAIRKKSEQTVRSELRQINHEIQIEALKQEQDLLYSGEALCA